MVSREGFVYGALVQLIRVFKELVFTLLPSLVYLRMNHVHGIDGTLNYLITGAQISLFFCNLIGETTYIFRIHI